MIGLQRRTVSPSQLEHEPEHAVGRRVLRAHVDDHGLVVGDRLGLRLGGRGLADAQHGATLAEALGAGGDVGAGELLGALVGALDGTEGGYVVGRGHGVAPTEVTGWPGRP